jgi:hypothetical protein
MGGVLSSMSPKQLPPNRQTQPARKRILDGNLPLAVARPLRSLTMESRSNPLTNHLFTNHLSYPIRASFQAHRP